MTKENNLFNDLLYEHVAAISTLRAQYAAVNELALMCSNTIRSGGKILFCGNGGSAGDAQHLAAEFVGRFEKERGPMAAIALTTDSSILTAIGNDYGFEHVFSRQIQALGKSIDLVFLISTSGNSDNLISACKTSKRLGIPVVGLLGNQGGKLSNLCDRSVIVDHQRTARIQECHIFIGHYICTFVESNVDE